MTALFWGFIGVIFSTAVGVIAVVLGVVLGFTVLIAIAYFSRRIYDCLF